MAALDLVICSEHRVFDKVTEGARIHQLAPTNALSHTHTHTHTHKHTRARAQTEISTRPVASASPVHVLNLDTIDDDANAKANAARALKLCQLVRACVSSK